LPFINGYYLAGGTGLAIMLGHRYSIDLDFFSPDITAVSIDHRDALRRLWNDPTLEVTYDTDGTFVASWRGVGVIYFVYHSTHSF
jgi:hypothetical protein